RDQPHPRTRQPRDPGRVRRGRRGAVARAQAGRRGPRAAAREAAGARSGAHQPPAEPHLDRRLAGPEPQRGGGELAYYLEGRDPRGRVLVNRGTAATPFVVALSGSVGEVADIRPPPESI